jgi:hypothetical protein
MKAGIKTSEFWYTLPVVAVGLLASFGLIAPKDTEILVELGAQTIGGFMALLALINYVNGRVKLKSQALDSQNLVLLNQAAKNLIEATDKTEPLNISTEEDPVG